MNYTIIIFYVGAYRAGKEQLVIFEGENEDTPKAAERLLRSANTDIRGEISVLQFGHISSEGITDHALLQKNAGRVMLKDEGMKLLQKALASLN